MDTEAKSREEFETWISGPPHARSVLRYPGASDVCWPDQYRDYFTQIAWEAWDEARTRTSRLAADLFLTDQEDYA
jgi:hypothetical protein